MLKLCVLASGSSGNCIFIGNGSTRILIDAGISARQTAVRLAEIGERVEDLDAICVSHEHGDHVAGIRVLHRKYGIPVYANAGTLDALNVSRKHDGVGYCQFTTGAPFCVGGLAIEPFSVPHDAYEPVGFVVRSGDLSAGIATDMGVVTHLVREKLRRCQVVVLEANHDEALLHAAERPWRLKQRINGNQGHLSNRAAAILAAEMAGGCLQHLFLAHLSSDCNSPHHARAACEMLLADAGHTHVTVRLTSAREVSEILELE
jgi:phosphoribosyl 1,2-cyclic phosphodiesterase